MRAPPRFLFAVLLIVAACSDKTTVVRPPKPAATPALVASLPEGCTNEAPSPAASVAFVAGGRAWAVQPDGSGLECLFAIRDAGPFDWGPRSDRVLTQALGVRSSSGLVLHPPGDAQPAAFSWGHPTGRSIVFVDKRAPQLLQKVSIGGAISDITPIKGVSYTAVEYHPSGLAIAFTVEGKDVNAIWLSSNTGKDPKRLVASTKGTRFGALSFDADGQGLLYAAQLSDGSSRLARYLLMAGSADEGLWVGSKPILRFARGGRGPGVAFDIGTGCEDRTAMYSSLDESEGQSFLPAVTSQTTVIGRIAGTRFLVAAGTCDGPFDLWIADAGGSPTLLARSVDRAATRIAETDPPPDLPEVGVSSRFF